MRHHEMSCEEHDHALTLLDTLTASSPQKLNAKAFARRDAALDPLMIAAAAASGPHVTRNHYHHDFFPAVSLPKAEGAWDWTKWAGEDAGTKQERKRLAYVSRQAPRRVRLQAEARKENDHPREIDFLKAADNLPRRSSIIDPYVAIPLKTGTLAIPAQKPPVEVKCLARTRIPTPHGPAFLHLYHNNWDNKEHLAIVIDPAQYETSPLSAPPIRSQSLDAVWSETETEMDRITRGAYVGKLSSTSHIASTTLSSQHHPLTNSSIPSPLIRIHSECFTGETIGSMRCDCGEQLDEAIRLISQPISLPPSPSASATTMPGRGAVIYLRQEGRGIGLLSKIRAYNLQDLGHDTVTANLMLGHKADERGYEVAGAILRDLGLGLEGGEGVRLLTNNPDKVQALEKEALKIVERVPMIPRSWQLRQSHPAKQVSAHVEKVNTERVVGATLIGGGAVCGVDLDKYLRTKVLRMGHMLPLWMDNSEV